MTVVRAKTIHGPMAPYYSDLDARSVTKALLENDRILLRNAEGAYVVMNVGMMTVITVSEELED
jgi:hypothetical protein